MALTLVVEDGTGLANANTYVSLADANTYAESSLTAAATAWKSEADDEKKKAALISASRYLTYSFDWIGTKKTSTQALAFPRTGVVIDGQEIPDDIVPQEVKDACSELAIQYLAGNGQTGTTEQDGNVAKIGVGKGAVDIQFHDKLASTTIPEQVAHLLSKWGTASTIDTSKGFSIKPVSR